MWNGWVDGGRVALLGDACHPTLPNLGHWRRNWRAYRTREKFELDFNLTKSDDFFELPLLNTFLVVEVTY
jgi:hypothetical protein